MIYHLYCAFLVQIGAHSQLGHKGEKADRKL